MTTIPPTVFFVPRQGGTATFGLVIGGSSGGGGGGGAVTSVFGRTGAVVAASGDYTAYYQPLDTDLTAIAALTTTTYGRNLLTLANQAALFAALGSGTPSSTTYLRGDGTWATIAAGGVTAFNTRTGAITPLAADYSSFFVSSTGTNAYGLALLATTNLAALQAILGTTGTPSSTTFLRGDGTWSTPPAGAVTSVFTRTGAVVASSGDYSSFYVSSSGTAAYGLNLLTTTNIASLITAMTLAGTPSSSTFFRGDGQWATPAGGGNVSGTGTTVVGHPAVWSNTSATGLVDGTFPVTTIFGRSGVVVATTGDYTAAQVTGAVPNTITVSAGTGLTGGGDLSANRTLSFAAIAANSVWANVTGGSAVPTVQTLNLALVGSTNWVAKGDIHVGSATAYATLTVGSNAQILVADSAQTLGVKWKTGAPSDVALGSVTNDAQLKVADMSAKGVILVGTGVGTYVAVTVGSNTQVLTADSTQTSGVKWAPAAGGGGGSVATDAIWTVKGQLAAATGSGAAVVVAPGTTGQALIVDTSVSSNLKYGTLDQIAPPAASLSLNSQKVTSLLPGTVATDGANLHQTQSLLVVGVGNNVTNTASLSDLFAYTVLANTVNAGDVYEVRAGGTFTQNIASPPTTTVGFRFGTGASILSMSTGAAPAQSATPHVWDCFTTIYFPTTSSQIVSGYFGYGNSTGSSTGWQNINSFTSAVGFMGFGTQPAAIATSSNQDIHMVVQFNTTSTSVAMNCTYYVVKKILVGA